MSNFRQETLLREKLGFDAWTVKMTRHKTGNVIYLTHRPDNLIVRICWNGETHKAVVQTPSFEAEDAVYGQSLADLCQNMHTLASKEIPHTETAFAKLATVLPSATEVKTFLKA